MCCTCTNGRTNMMHIMQQQGQEQLFRQQVQLACEEASRVGVKEMGYRLNQEWRQQIMVVEPQLEGYRNNVMQHENRLQGEL